VRHTFGLAWRSLVSLKHNPRLLLDLSIQPIMILLLFTFVFGEAIYGSSSAYVQFMLPGIMVQNAIVATFVTAVGLNADLTNGVYHRLRSLPIARWSPLAGRILAETVKQVWAITLLLVVGMIIGFRIHGGVLEVLATYGLLLTFSFAVSWMAVLIGVIVDRPEKVSIYSVVVAFPLTFTSNAFVPIEKLGTLRIWAEVNPVTIVADAVRALLAGAPAESLVVWSLVWATAITVVFVPLAVSRLNRRAL
jgi:ABC-2 type transport system permease protein/oleandomycin transport system permease protein